MGNVNVFIKNNIHNISKSVLISPNIPEEKLNNAIKSFRCENFYKTIVAICDSTTLGNAKEGLVFTGEKLIYNNGKDVIVFNYKDIESVVHHSKSEKNFFAQEENYQYVIIKTNGEYYKLDKLSSFFPSDNFNYQSFADLLNTIITKFDVYEEENQLKPLSEMSEKLKIAYVQAVINMCFGDSETINENDLAEIFLLMTRLEFVNDSRFQLRNYIADIRNSIQPLDDLLHIIKNEGEVSHLKSIKISLVKDMINIYFSTHDDMTCQEFKFLQENKKLFSLSDDEINLAIEAVKTDHLMLKENVSDDAIIKSVKGLATQAAAVGVPLAAVYLSGSVVGFSAAGITSGLATLGMGGVLGFSGMVTGLGMAVTLGVVTYKGIEHLSGANELDKFKRRELMLHEVIKQTHKTISFVIDDLNFVIQKLNNTIIKHGEQSEKIKKLMVMVAQFQGALQSVDKKSDRYQNLAFKLQCPQVLDIERIKALTSEPIKQPIFEFISAQYEEKIVVKENKEISQYVLREDISTNMLDELTQAFQAIEYFNMNNILKAKASEALDKTKGMLKSWTN